CSASVGGDNNKTAQQFLSQIPDHIPQGDWAVVKFAGRANRRSAETSELEVMQSAPAEAVRLAARLMPAEHVPRIVLLSDGQQSHGDVITAAGQAGIPVDVVPLPPDPWPEVRLAAVSAVTLARIGDSVEIVATVETNRTCRGRLEVLEKDEIVA
ncbi:MAG: hypothetical protein GTO04_05810, partial [Planctomycetales bacterium]|nr:hypothetical protein [Planctomycetales bacterium]